MKPLPVGSSNAGKPPPEGSSNAAVVCTDRGEFDIPVVTPSPGGKGKLQEAAGLHGMEMQPPWRAMRPEDSSRMPSSD